MSRRETLLKLLSLPLLGMAGSAHAQQDFPNRPVRLLVPFPPGGSVTTAARLIADKLAEKWKQPVVIDNRPGANGVIASTELVRSKPDGYTLLLDVNQHTINPFVLRNLPYDTLKDFRPVGLVYRFELILVANPALPVQTLADFIGLAKASPGKLNYATADNGGLTHLASESFCLAAGIKLQQIPYKGSGPALVDVLAGQVQIYFSSPSAALPHVNSGKLKALAWTGKSRSPSFPSVPTFAEAGLAHLDASSWGGLFVPADTPADIVTRISTDLQAVLAAPEVKDRFSNLSLEAFSSTPAEFAAVIKADLAKYSRVVKETNLRVD